MHKTISTTSVAEYLDLCLQGEWTATPLPGNLDWKSQELDHHQLRLLEDILRQGPHLDFSVEGVGTVLLAQVPGAVVVTSHAAICTWHDLIVFADVVEAVSAASHIRASLMGEPDADDDIDPPPDPS